MPRQLTQSLVQLDDAARLVVERGRRAWRELKSDETFEKWVAIGRAIDIGRKETMRALHTNRPAGAQWSRVFGAWLEEQGFAEIDKGARSRLQDCLDNLPAIEAWRQTLGLTQRLQLNHPNAVWRRFQATRQHPSPDDKAGSSARPGLREENMRLQSDLDDAHKEIERLRRGLDEGNDWDWQDTPEEIAKAMLRSHPAKAKRVGAAILTLSKSTAQKPRQQF
jgi:hypothetical protein